MHAAISESWPVRPEENVRKLCRTYAKVTRRFVPAGFDIDISRVDFWSSPEEPAVISEGKIPGAMQLTRTLVSTNVVAIMRVMWMNPALEVAYANWPLLVPFITPEMDATLHTEDEKPGVRSRPFASNGKKAAVIKYCAVRLVWNVSCHCSGSLCIM